MTNKVVPLPYDPFSNKLAVELPSDPKDLQQIFHDMRTGEGLFNHAVKLFAHCPKRVSPMKPWSSSPDQGGGPHARRGGSQHRPRGLHQRRLAQRGSQSFHAHCLTEDVKFVEACKYVLEMMDKGMRPNVQTYTCVFEGLVREEKLDEAARLLEQMKGKGFVPDEKAVREVLASKKGTVFRNMEAYSAYKAIRLLPLL
ncbi:Pentatricopeptide repeat-containing protein, mitochondrial [Glycine soja]